MHRMLCRAGISLVALSGCLIAIAPASAIAAQSQVQVGAAPVLPPGARVTGSLSADRQLQLTVMLEPRDPVALEDFATAVATPGSPSYKQYLSVEQFAQRFGATPAQVSTVQAALRSEGLEVGAAAANDLTLPVSGTAAQVEQALSVSLAKVETSSGRTAYVNQQAASVPSSAAPYVQGVVGLEDLAPDQPQGAPVQAGGSANPFALSSPSAQVVTGGPQPCPEAAAHQAIAEGTHGPFIGYTADQIASVYQFSGLYGAGDFGSGQTIAVFEQEPYSPTDIATYQACYRTAASVSNVEVAGGPGAFQGKSGEGGESELDIEQIIGLAPAASILVYQGPPTANAPVEIISAMVSQNKAKVISSSWGECEELTGATVMNAENTLLQEAASQGQSFFVSSGDSGSEQCSQVEEANTSLSVLNPASQPFATGVGGTFLNPPVTGPPPQESVWNEGPRKSGGGGTGGGVSKQWTMPSYQSGAASSLGVINSSSSATPCNGGSTDCREVPDISADSDSRTGYIVFTGGQWGVTGGTSAAAPLWAALAGLANASAACRGIPVGFVNPALYQLGGSSYTSDFHDISKANEFTGLATNDTLFHGTQPYPVTANYDMTTGIGTPVAQSVAAGLCAIASPVYTVAIKSPGNQTSALGKRVKLQISGTDSGNAALTYSAAGLPAGLAISSSGLITGKPTKVGSSKVTVSASDASHNSGSVQFTWQVTPVSVSHVVLSGLAKRKPKLKFTLSTAAHTPAISSVTLTLPKGLTLAASPKALKRGVAVSGTKVKLKARHGKLQIDLLHSRKQGKFKLAQPALGVSGSLAGKVKHHKVKSLKLKFAVTTSPHHTTTFSASPKVH